MLKCAVYILRETLLSREEEYGESEKVEESLEYLQWRASKECVKSKT